MASRLRKPTTTTTSKPTTIRRTRPPPANPDELADALASRLKIGGPAKSSSSRQTTTNATTATPKDVKTESMRAINTAMQAMTSLAASGWKKSAGETDRTAVWRSQNAEANKLVAMSKDHLATLRGIDGATVEIERAALSVIGKLVTMEMNDAALEALKEMYIPLCSALHADEAPTTPKLAYLSLPLPSQPVQDPVYLTMISTYLIHALTTTCFHGENADDIASILSSPNYNCLLDWLPSFDPLPRKHIDSLLTRAYTSLTKACANRPTTSKASSSTRSRTTTQTPGTAPSYRSIFLLRGYALQCLVRASPGTVEPDAYWDQVARFTASFARSCAEAKGDEEEGAQLVMAMFNRIVIDAQVRVDATRFCDGTKFMAFCEFWMGFAKRTGDICTLDRIGGLVQKIPSTSSAASRSARHATPAPASSASAVPAKSSPTTSAPRDEDTAMDLEADKVQEKSTSPPPSIRDLVLEGTKLCSALAQTVALAEKLLQGDSSASGDEFASSLKACDTMIQKSGSLPVILFGTTHDRGSPSRESNDDLRRISGKVDRALERLRRCTHKLVESSTSSQDVKTIASALLKTCVEALQPLLSYETDDVDLRTDVTTRCIDSLFVLARTSLDISNPQTYIPAYDRLEEAAKIMDVIESNGGTEAGGLGSIDTPNYLRCISGAFYNLAGALYQGMRYGAAVPFLKQTCDIGIRALEGHGERLAILEEGGSAKVKGKGKESTENEEKEKMKEREREKEWAQLEVQLYRRWELLAVCYLKNGDRKNSYEAFMKCIHTFPFSTTTLASDTDTKCLSAIFTTGDPKFDPTLKALSSLLDRVSYVGACELLLPADQVSLYASLRIPSKPKGKKSKIDLRIVGILLEYQYASLFDGGHRWKEGARPALVQLLKDTLGVYGTRDRVVEGYLMPVRRARVLVRCLEFLYRDEGGERVEEVLGELGFANLEEVGREVLELLSRADLGLDAGLGMYKTQYMASVHLWLANLAHRYSSTSSSTSSPSAPSTPSEPLLWEVPTYVDEANVLLEVLLNDAVVASKASATASKASRKVSVGSPAVAVVGRRIGGGGGGTPRPSLVGSPKASRITRQRGPPPAPRKAPAASRRVPVAKEKEKAKAKAPVTPKTKASTSRAAVHAVVEKAGPRASMDVKVAAMSAIPFDDFGKFHDLLMLTTRILGLLSLFLPRFQLLGFLRKLCQRQLGSASEEFIIASLELAYEYAKLGKLKRALSVFSTALDIVRSGETSPEVAAFFLLRFSETLALMNDVPKSSAVYLEAFEHSDRLLGEHKGLSSTQRIVSRAGRLELSAMACRVFGLIQSAREDATVALSSMLQSLRLWNRAIETTARLAPRSSTSTNAQDTSSSQNPFDASGGWNESGAADQSPAQAQGKLKASGKSSTELQWRLLEGLINVLFSLAEAYLMRGSPREAEYFLKQVQTLAESTGLPAISTRAVTRLVEVQLGLGKLEEARTLLEEAAEKLGEAVALDGVDYQRLLARYNEKMARQQEDEEEAEEEKGAVEPSGKALEMLQTLNGDFQRLDGQMMGVRKSLDMQDAGGEYIVPELLSTVLSRYIWLLRGNGDQEFDALLTKLCTLPPSFRIESQKNSLLAHLTLHKVHQRFQSDMFLNSLTESTISIPMGMSSRGPIQRMLPVNDVLNALDSAEKYFQESIALTAKAGDVMHFRDAAVSLTLVKAFQTSLGRLDELNAVHASALLDASSAITLRREMLEAIQQKLAALKPSDDFAWPMVTEEGVPKTAGSSSSCSKRKPMLLGDSDIESDDDEREDQHGKKVNEYWESVRSRYQAKLLDDDSLRDSQTKELPSNWTIIHVNLADDNSKLLLSRQECGNASSEPLLFCIPLNGRRDDGTGDDEGHLSFDDAIGEFAEIIRLSNESTKAAVHVRSDDEEARAKWWKERNALDVRLKELLENIELCWLGAFKTILSPRSNLTPEQLDDLRTQFDKVFQRNIQVKEKKTKARTGHKRAASVSQAPSQVYLDDAMLRCFSGLSPKCRDEELEDLLYFVLDLYQFHGVPVVTAEVDAMQAVVDLRIVLEEHNGRLLKARKGNMSGGTNRTTASAGAVGLDEHVFLILDKNVQGLPWESLPSLRGRSVSRIPCIDFLHDRIAFAAVRREQRGMQDTGDGTAVVNPKNGYFVLNPSGDLVKTQGRFQEWVDGMKRLGWDGVVGEAVTEHQFSEALRQKDLVVYFGHGGGEQYIRSQRIRGLPTCAATMLWGCSSGALKDMGDFDRIGTPYNYMLGGCPTLIANLWDVTDRDIDKFSLSVFDKIGLHGTVLSAAGSKAPSKPMSVATAVAQSREVCKLKYLTGAAPVIYGIPFYL